jgi:hypothetical protein
MRRQLRPTGGQERGWKEQDLPGWTKGHKEKVALPRRLRSETTMSLKWTPRRLRMGSWTYVSDLLAAKRKRTKSLLTLA